MTQPGGEPEERPSGWSPGLTILGMLAFVPLNIVIGLGVLTLTDGNFTVMAVSLGVVTFGVGVVLVLRPSIKVRSFGAGLMLGWALVTLVSGGLCTGIPFGGGFG